MLQISELLCHFYLTKESTKVINVIKFIPSTLIVDSLKDYILMHYIYHYTLYNKKQEYFFILKFSYFL